MKPLSSLKLRLGAGIGLMTVAAALYAASIGVGTGADAKPAKNAKAETKQKTEKKAARTGQELYQMNCARCHPERYATERTDAQWKTIMFHMRVRAQIPAGDSRKILEYLQSEN